MFRRILTGAAIVIGKPYIKRELPGWGQLYRVLVGGYQRDRLWADYPERWVRGKLHGYEMSLRIGGWSNRSAFFLERFYDLPTQLAMQLYLRPGDCFVDIGANEGMMSLLGSRLVGPEGKVISFEPNPGPREFLQRNLSRNDIRNVEVRGHGLADEPGVLELFVPAVNTGQASFAPLDQQEGEKVLCTVVVGDEALADEQPRLIKIDVEGFEGRVIEGLKETLSTHRPIICLEMYSDLLGRAGSSPDEVISLMESLGYDGKRLTLSTRKELAFAEISVPWRDGDYIWRPTAPASGSSAVSVNG